jgi:hypothetical protein
VIEIYRARDDDPTELARLAADGLLRPLVADVYVGAQVPDDTEVRAAALALLLPPPLQDGDAVTGFEAAAWLIVGGPPPVELDVYVPAHRSRRRFRGLRVHEARLEGYDVETIGTVRTTCPARTAADLCRSRPTDQAIPHLDRLRAATGLRPVMIACVLDRLARHRGVPHGRNVIEIWAARLDGLAACCPGCGADRRDAVSPPGAR